MKSAILILTCQDQKGIVAGLSSSLYRLNANILTADQYTSLDEAPDFFIRLSFEYDESSVTIDMLRCSISDVAETLSARWRLFSAQDRLKMGVMVSKEDHCVHDLLYHWKAGDLQVDIPFVISNHACHKDLVSHY